MNKISALVGLALLASTVGGTARADAVTDRCAQYAKLVTDQQPFKDGVTYIDRTYSPSTVYDVLKTCPSQAKLTKALYVPLEFMDYQGQEDEGGKVWAPSDTTTTIAQAMAELRASVQKVVDGYKQQVKSGKVDEQSLKASLRYLIWNWDYQEAPYSYVALELLARMYPGDYAGVKGLARDEGGNYQDYDQVAEEWLHKTPPAKH